MDEEALSSADEAGASISANWLMAAPVFFREET
jgi:hypothetical protein